MKTPICINTSLQTPKSSFQSIQHICLSHQAERFFQKDLLQRRHRLSHVRQGEPSCAAHRAQRRLLQSGCQGWSLVLERSQGLEKDKGLLLLTPAVNLLCSGLVCEEFKGFYLKALKHFDKNTDWNKAGQWTI